MPISAEVRAEITTQMEKVKRGEKLVSMIDKILALLKKRGLAWSQKLLPHQVGCQLRNRDGVGISTSEVHGLITDILQVSKISPGGNSLHLLGNGSIRDRGCGIQPPAAEGKCRKASKSQHRVDQVCERCWFSPERRTELLDSWGHTRQSSMDRSRWETFISKMAEMDKPYHAACVGGLPWLVVARDVGKEFPDFPKLLQSELQLLRKIHLVCVEMKAAGKETIMWKDISPRVLSSKPTLSLALQCPQLFQFVVKFSGGIAGHLLESSEAFCRAHGHSHRTLGSMRFFPRA